LFGLGAQGLDGSGRGEHVVGRQKPNDPGFAHRKGTEDQRPVRNRFIAGDGCGAGKRAGGAGYQGRHVKKSLYPSVLFARRL